MHRPCRRKVAGELLLRRVTSALCAGIGLLVGFPVRGQPAKPHAFSMIGWQLQDYNLPELEAAIKAAPAYHINVLIFSHDLFRSVAGFLASADGADPDHPPAWVRDLRLGKHFKIIPGWQSNLRRLGDLATQEHISYYLWVHEFDDVPTAYLKNGRVDMDNPDLFRYLKVRYERLLDAVPGCAGFVVTLSESDFDIFRNSEVSSRLPVPDRIYRVADFFHDLLRAHHKQLIIRNFFYEPWEMTDFKQAVVRLPDDVIVMSKDTTHEFDPFYPWDPLHGQVGRKRQIMEIDLGVEKALGSQGIYVQADYLRRAVARARATGMAGAVGRCRLFWKQPFAHAPGANLYAFSRFMTQPGLNAREVVTDWARLHYDPRAVPYVTDALLRTQYINHHARYHLDEWFTKGVGDGWNHYAYYFGHPVERCRSKWTHLPADVRLEQKLADPDEATYRALLAEKDEVIGQLNQSMADIRRADPWLTSGQRAYFRAGYAYLRDAVQLERDWVQAYFAQEMYVHSGSATSKADAEQALAELERLNRAPGVNYGRDSSDGDRYHIDAFVSEMRKRMSDPTRALAEDRHILAKARREALPQ